MYKTYKIERHSLGEFLNQKKESQDGIDIIHIDPEQGTDYLYLTLEFYEMPDEIAFHLRSQ